MSASKLSGATIALCTSSEWARSRISLRRGAEKPSVDQVETSARSISATRSAFRPWWSESLDLTVFAPSRSPMNRHLSAGATFKAKVRAHPRATIRKTISSDQSSRASRRSRVPPATTKPPASHAHSAPRVATWKSFGASSRVVLCKSDSSRS